MTTTKVIKQGVVQEVIDDFQNGNVMGKSLLKLKANYVALGWNFDENWEIFETECFPYKKYQLVYLYYLFPIYFLHPKIAYYSFYNLNYSYNF